MFFPSLTNSECLVLLKLPSVEQHSPSSPQLYNLIRIRLFTFFFCQYLNLFPFSYVVTHQLFCQCYFFLFLTVCYRAFLGLIKKKSVCAAVIVLYNTLVTSYIFWAHHIKEYCAKTFQYNEAVPNMLLVDNRICHIT